MNKKVILASTSPRRKQLLKRAGVSFRAIPPQYHEFQAKGDTPVKLVRRNAEEKARVVFSSRRRSRNNEVILGADTIVVSPDRKQILEKPRSARDAFRMLSALSGKTHIVVTGYCLLSEKKKVSRLIRTRVKMRKLSSHEIKRYIAKGESMDKAGAYAAQGFGMVLIEKIQGSYTNVVGLPISELLKDLDQFQK